MIVIEIYIRLKKTVPIVYPNNDFWLFIGSVYKNRVDNTKKNSPPTVYPSCLP